LSDDSDPEQPQLSLAFRAGSEFAATTCRPVLISVLEPDGATPSTFSANASLQLSSTLNGGFYTDDDCASATTAIGVSAGQSQALAYFRDDQAETPRLTATLSDYDPGDLDASVIPMASPGWTTLNPATKPSARWGVQVVFHQARGTWIAYGGVNNAMTAAYDDMWEFDGTDWTRLCTGCGPGERTFHSMVYDSARDRIVLFGGSDFPVTTHHGDVWEWDGTSWAQITPGGSAPSARRSAYMAYDSLRERVVLFGGRNGASVFDNVYEYDGTDWTGPVTPATRPSARHDDSASSAATFDPIRGRMIVYGGCTALDCSTTVDSAWAWDGMAWTELCSACTGDPRYAATVEFDPIRDRLVVVGGYDQGAGASFAGSWEMNGQTGAWSNPHPATPTARDNGSLRIDPGSGRMIYFGGNGQGCGGGNCDETIELN
jgi:hypothetical protein